MSAFVRRFGRNFPNYHNVPAKEFQMSVIPPEERNLLRRINRHLASKGQAVKKSRSERARTEVGDYYMIDTDKNVMLLTRVNLESLAKDLGLN